MCFSESFLSASSGRSPKAQTLELMQSRGYTKGSPTPPFHALNITVPGAAACWCDTIQLFGSKKVPLFLFALYISFHLSLCHVG